MKELASQARIDRLLCQKSLYYLCKEVLGYRDMVPHVHGDLCYFGTAPEYGRFRQACVPRSWFKTWCWTIGKSLWLTLPDENELFADIYPYKGPNVRILIASNVIDYAAKVVNTIKRYWETNARLKAAFPELLPDFNKTRWSDHCAEVRRQINSQEGTYTAIGVGGSVIGQHFDHIMEDDLVFARKDDFTGEELMPNQEDIDNAVGWHKLTYSLLSNPKQGCIDNIGTRWAPHDLVDYIRRRETAYSCLEITATRDAIWPIPDDSYCVWPERYDKATLDNIREAQGAKIFECFPAEAPVLMADFSLKPISAIAVGDAVVGFSCGEGKSKSKLVKAEVNLLERMTKRVVRITLANGDVVRSTADHPWYTGRKDKSHRPYAPAKVGGYLLRVCELKEVSSEALLDYRYLAGIVDGEGACNHGSIAIGQSKQANPEVYEEIEKVLNRLGIPYKVCKVNPYDTHILRNKEIRRGLGESFVLGGGREIKADIIRFGNPAKKEAILNTIWSRPHHPIKGKSKIVSIELCGEETVYAIGTTSGNYVAYGYATKNTQYLNRPRAGEDVTFDIKNLEMHETRETYPHDLKWLTIVDLATWKDKKRICNNVVITGAKDSSNHIWIGRVDAGKYNPTEVIELIKAHHIQFKSKVFVEEVGYQVALRHFARLEMQKEGSPVYIINQLPADNRKGAKELRINSLEPLVKNGMFHVLSGMKMLLREMEDYPYGSTRDILDVCGFLVKVARPQGVKIEEAVRGAFDFDTILAEIEQGKSVTGLPFDVQLQAAGIRDNQNW